MSTDDRRSFSRVPATGEAVPELSLEYQLASEWDVIELIRAAVALSAKAVVPDRDDNDALTMITAELLENAVKHGRPEGTVRYTLRVYDDSAVVRVMNEVDPATSAEVTLTGSLEWLRSFSDPFEAYTQRMQEVLETRGQIGGLGLVRIACEGGAILSCCRDDEGHLVVTAFMPRGNP